MISVVIPCFNSEKTIKRAIDSVLSQTYQNYQVIVVDDGSSDNTEQVLSNYGQKIIYIKQDNKGPSSARNLGVQHACGEFIAFLDADDTWMPTKLMQQWESLKFHDNAGLCCTGYKNIYENGRERVYFVAENTATLPNGTILNNENIIGTPYLLTSTIMIKKALFLELGGYDETLRMAEDIDLYLKVMLASHIIRIEEVLVTRFFLDDGLSAKNINFDAEAMVYRNFILNHHDFYIAHKKAFDSHICDSYASAATTTTYVGNDIDIFFYFCYLSLSYGFRLSFLCKMPLLLFKLVVKKLIILVKKCQTSR